MKANELRAGNFIDLQGQLTEAMEIKPTNRHDGWLINGIPDTMYNGIQLTEEWLLKFGFEEMPYSFSFERFRITKQDNSNIWFTAFNANGAHINKIQYVHQLQNLYFALTGEELHL